MIRKKLFGTRSRSELVPWFESKTRRELDPRMVMDFPLFILGT